MQNYFNILQKEIDTPTNEVSFPTIQEIYKKSIIDWEDLYDMIAIISYKSSNNIDSFLTKPFYIINPMMKKINNLIEKENGGSGNADQNEQFESMQKNAQDSISGMKKSFKPPKLDMPKLKF